MSRRQSWHECNVALPEGEILGLWSFSLAGGKAHLRSRKRAPQEGRLPEKVAAKSWKHLIRGRLDLALLPESDVFLRVVRLPECDRQEMESMLEFQLERLSPFPVNQICWSFETLPCGLEGQATALVMIAESHRVEARLERLEEAGYSADRLEPLGCHELLDLDLEEDRIWIRLSPQEEGVAAMTAWILGGTLQQAMVLSLPATQEGCRALCSHLEHAHWTGEMEGWAGPEMPPIDLRQAPGLDPSWEAALREWSPHPLQPSALPGPEEQASLTAGRVARNEAQADLLPQERRIRYRQHFVDGIWMKGVGAMVLCYIFGVLAYFIMVEWARIEHQKVEARYRVSAPQYTNVVRMEGNIRTLEEQAARRTAALDCLQAIASILPPEVDLTGFQFAPGRQNKVTLSGTVLSSNDSALTRFYEDLNEAAVGGRKLFSQISDPIPTPKTPLHSTWKLDCTLN